MGVVVVVAIAGIMSGLTLGLLSMDRLDMELMLRTGSKKQERYARRWVGLRVSPVALRWCGQQRHNSSGRQVDEQCVMCF